MTMEEAVACGMTDHGPIVASDHLTDASALSPRKREAAH
jgi:hypothetical protein